MKQIMLPFLLSVVCAACLPARLDKYRNKDGALLEGGPALGSPEALQPPALATKGLAPTSSPAAPQAPVQAPQRASIYALDKQTFRFALREGDVWDAALNVLLRNYNLTIVDKSSGIVTTEWDTYFLNQEVYRNRLSMRISRGAGSGVDLMIHNNVERLRDASQATGAVGAVWLPAEDGANETARIVQNMALVLNQPPPVLPPNSAVAGAAGKTGTFKN